MQAQPILSCQYASWYRQFGHLAFKSKLIELPQDFTGFLLQDGVFLSESSSALPRRAAPDPLDTDYKDWEEEGLPGNEDDGHKRPDFPELRAAIEAGIQELGGCVAPKFSWSSPHDATWVTASHSLACSTADEVLLLLKSSDRVAHDICHAFDSCEAPPGAAVQHTLALRKWVALRPERELRCFVRQRELTAISQRHVLESAHQLQSQAEELKEMLLEFFEQHLQENFPETSYTFDVYITTAGRVRLLDFNPIGGTTSPLLFSWEELGYAVTDPLAAHLPDTAPGQCSNTGSCAQNGSRPETEMPASTPGQASSQGDNAVQPSMRQQDVDTISSESKAHETVSREGKHSSSKRLRDIDGIDGEQEEIAVRFAEQGASMLRPASAVYGAPYDMADLSEGGAIADMLRRVQTQEPD